MLDKTEMRWLGSEYDRAVKASYEVAMLTHTMEPKVEVGEYVWVLDPSAEIETGNLAVVHLLGEGNSILTYVKKFVSKNASELVLEQLNPPEGEDRILRFPADHVIAVHRASGWGGRNDASCPLSTAS